MNQRRPKQHGIHSWLNPAHEINFDLCGRRHWQSTATPAETWEEDTFFANNIEEQVKTSTLNGTPCLPVSGESNYSTSNTPEMDCDTFEYMEAMFALQYGRADEHNEDEISCNEIRAEPLE